MGFPAARIGDMHVCPMVTPAPVPVPHVGGPILPPGVPTVFIGGMPAAVVGNMCTCVGPPDVIVKGSLGVFIGGMPAARMGDMTAHGGTIVMGCFTVLIGDIIVRTPCVIIAQIQANPPPSQQLLEELANSVAVNTGNSSDASATARHFQATSQALDNARLSLAVYGAPDPPGFRRITGEGLRQFNLSDEDMVNTDTGFRAGIYESTNGREPRYVAAFAGTDDTGDGVSDVRQGLGGRDPQYDQANLIGRRMRTSTGPNGFTTTGHSLGGGLASFVSADTGADGTTFNAAGIHQNTLDSAGISDSQRDGNRGHVDSYQNSHCPLSTAQNNREVGLSIGGLLGGGLLGLGASIALLATGAMPRAYGNRIEVPSAAESYVSGHGIAEMVELLEKQTRNDLANLTSQFNC